MDRALGLDELQFQNEKKKTLDILLTLLTKNSLTIELYNPVAIVSESPDDETYEHLIAKLEDNGRPPHIIIGELVPGTTFKDNYRYCTEADKDKLIAYGLHAFRCGVLALFELHKWFANPKASTEEKYAFRKNYYKYRDRLLNIFREDYLPDEVPESQREQPSEFIGQDQEVKWLTCQQEILAYLKIGSHHTLKKYRDQGLPVFKTGGSLRADPKEIDKWIKKNPPK